MLEKLMAEIAAIKEQLEATDKVRSALVIGRAVASVASCCDVVMPSWLRHGRRCRCDRCCCASSTQSDARCFLACTGVAQDGEPYRPGPCPHPASRPHRQRRDSPRPAAEEDREPPRYRWHLGCILSIWVAFFSAIAAGRTCWTTRSSSWPLTSCTSASSSWRCVRLASCHRKNETMCRRVVVSDGWRMVVGRAVACRRSCSRPCGRSRASSPSSSWCAPCITSLLSSCSSLSLVCIPWRQT